MEKWQDIMVQKWMDRWMDGKKNATIDRWKYLIMDDGWKDGEIDRWKDKYKLYGKIARWNFTNMEKWQDIMVQKWMDGWMDGKKNATIDRWEDLIMDDGWMENRLMERLYNYR